MVADAEANRAEDRQLRELTDARNELDSAAYQVERRLSELGQAVPVHEKARAETLVADARQAIADQAPAGRLLADERTPAGLPRPRRLRVRIVRAGGGRSGAVGPGPLRSGVTGAVPG